MKAPSCLILAIAGCLACAATTACARPVSVGAQEPGGMEAWERNHPEASRELGLWVKAHPAAARMFFEWDARHHERAHAFVTWSIQHPNEGIRAFASQHPTWETFDDIMVHHAPAANAFMAWCRRHAPAAEALMNHPGGLDWAGHHLYAAFWSMETR